MQVKVLLDTKHGENRVTTVEVSGEWKALNFLTKTPDFDEYRLTNKANCRLSKRFSSEDELRLVLTSPNWYSVFQGLNDTVNTNPMEREIVREIKRKIEESVPYESKYHFPELSREDVAAVIEKSETLPNDKKMPVYHKLTRVSGNLVQFPEQAGLSLQKLFTNSYVLARHYDTADCFEHCYVFEKVEDASFPLNVGASLLQRTLYRSDVALDIVEWFQRAKEFPTKDDLLVQIGCHYEEMGEFANAADTIQDVKSTVGSLLEVKADSWKTKTSFSKECLEVILNDKERKREVVDALADTVVTAIGVLYELTGDPIGVLSEVNRSNWSKFENGTPVFDENGKIKKGENYSKPDLDCFI